MVNNARWAGIAAVAVVAFVAFMATGSGRAADGAVGAAPAKGGAAGAPGASAVDASGGPGGAGGRAAAPAESAKMSARKGTAGLKTHHAAKVADAPEEPIGQGPPPSSPLTMNGLRRELDRERAPGTDPAAPPRVKLEQLLGEVSKARESLHQDTLRLEAMAGGDATADESSGTAPSGSAPAPAAAGPGQPPQKNPLDSLAKALRGIKPEQAAPIVARLDKGLAATVLLKMPPGDAGKIMGALKPEVAAELATQIAMRAPVAARTGGKK